MASHDQPTSESKWLISLMSGIIFILIASPFMFNLTQQLIANPLGQRFVVGGTPTVLGLAVHGLVYTLIVRLMMVN